MSTPTATDRLQPIAGVRPPGGDVPRGDVPARGLPRVELTRARLRERRRALAAGRPAPVAPSQLGTLGAVDTLRAAPRVLHRPRAVAVSCGRRPVQLTARGRRLRAVVPVLLALVLAAAVLAAGALSSPAARTTPPAAASVVVRNGDTLWSIAVRVAPQRDPRAEVDELARLNGVTGSGLVPGQVVRVR